MLTDVFHIVIALILVIVNGFFVAAEFALVKVRKTQVENLVRQKRPFSGMGLWLTERLEGSLSACQLGITMSSLGLGWVGEPAFAHLVRPAFEFFGMSSEKLLHAAAFVVAFGTITALHLVIGEQAPKIYAIRKPEPILLWCALPLKAFYLLAYPLMASLNWCTSVLLRSIGLEGADHDMPHSEEELRALILDARRVGNLSRVEHHLINAVFEFDDTTCRRIMVPRTDVVFFDVEQPLAECFHLARETKHTRYPVCDGSLDKVLGFVHMKDFIGLPLDDSVDLKTVLRPAQRVSENMPVTKLLRHFQATHQLLAIVVDEHGTVGGIVTLENVLEQIVGDVDDEFDNETPRIVSEAPGRWLILGGTPIASVEKKLNVEFGAVDVDTFSGLLTVRAGRLLSVGDTIDLGGSTAEVLEVDNDRAARVRVTIAAPEGEGAAGAL